MVKASKDSSRDNSFSFTTLSWLHLHIVQPLVLSGVGRVGREAFRQRVQGRQRVNIVSECLFPLSSLLASSLLMAACIGDSYSLGDALLGLFQKPIPAALWFFDPYVGDAQRSSLH